MFISSSVIVCLALASLGLCVLNPSPGSSDYHPLKARAADGLCDPVGRVTFNLPAPKKNRLGWFRPKTSTTISLRLPEPVLEGDVCVYEMPFDDKDWREVKHRLLWDGEAAVLVTKANGAPDDTFTDFARVARDLGILLQPETKAARKKWVVIARPGRQIRQTGTWRRFFNKLSYNPRQPSPVARQNCNRFLNTIFDKVVDAAVQNAEQYGLLYPMEYFTFFHVLLTDDLETVTFTHWPLKPHPWVKGTPIPESTKTLWKKWVAQSEINAEDMPAAVFDPDAEDTLPGVCYTETAASGVQPTEVETAEQGTE